MIELFCQPPFASGFPPRAAASCRDDAGEVGVPTATLLQQNDFATTGDPKFDRYLGGGFRSGFVTEVFGQAGVGKTQLLLSTACAAVSCGCRTAFYVSSEDMPHVRMSQIAAQFGDPEVVLAKVRVARVHSVEATAVLLERVACECTPSVVLIDSVAALCAGKDDVDRLGRMLRLLVAKSPVAVVCANQVRASLGTTAVLPALGLEWSKWVQCRICVSRPFEATRTASLVFCPYLAPAEPIQFRITHRGIEFL